MARLILKALGLSAAVAFAVPGTSPLFAADLTLPVPGIVIYPGEPIRDGVLVDRDFSLEPIAAGTVIDSRSALVGKVARRTLLPGRPIPVNGVAEPRVVSNGAQVKVVFQEGSLMITTYGAALQAGGVGDIIKVRNPESGIIVSGTIQADGSVRVSDS